MKTQSKKFYRQGDVALIPIAALPEGKRTRRANRVVVYGEVTGHKHQMSGDGVEVLEVEDGLFVRVTGAGVSIVHDEHAELKIPAGVYRARIQREYSPEEIRNVAD